METRFLVRKVLLGHQILTPQEALIIVRRQILAKARQVEKLVRKTTFAAFRAAQPWGA